MTAASCAWCEGPLPASARRDAITCSKRCRQARHRFLTASGRADARAVALGRPRRLAYADPPYPGKAFLYRDHPDYGGEVDHRELVSRLASFDAWALSTSAAALQDVLSLCPPGTRVAAWHRGERHNDRALTPESAWEPVLYFGDLERDQSTRALDAIDAVAKTRRVDSLVYVARPRLTDPHRVIGAKPAAFCRWIFDLLGAGPDDTLDDLFPGSGGIARAWRAYRAVDPELDFDLI